MPEWKIGTVIDQRQLSPLLTIFRLAPQPGSRFPDYVAGQYIALRRDRCTLTKRVVGPAGEVRFVPDLDASGRPRVGPVAHSYSIASAPFETRRYGWIEFYVVLERAQDGILGRLSSSFFDMDPPADDQVKYVDRITGHFTLERTAAGCDSVLFVGTGTGVAPFVSMIKELHHDACHGNGVPGQYTLLHTNRTYEELAYHQELRDIEGSRRFDFLYVASVSRPTERDVADPQLGRGRANNLLRHVFGLPMKEEADLQAAMDGGVDPSPMAAALARAVKPALPHDLSRDALLRRFDSSRTVLLSCGNPASMEDIKYVADTCGIRFEKEDW